VTQWPRGLVGYETRGEPDATPDPDEDRTGNRIRLAARLLGVLRARGRDVSAAVADLREAERAYQAGRRREATERVERLLGELDALGPDPGPSPTA
jgi:hypothetical protein